MTTSPIVVAVARHVAASSLVDHADQSADDVGLALAREEPRLLVGRQVVPLAVPGADGDRAVGLGQPVDVHRRGS